MNDCLKCNNTGWYSYDKNHSKPCEDCCQHSLGSWQLKEYNSQPGMWCCLAGCGYVQDEEWVGVIMRGSNADS